MSNKVENNKKGFTIIEVMLFLALTGMLFVGVVASTRGSMSRRRYMDSVQEAYDIFMTAYNNTENVQVDERGSSTAPNCNINNNSGHHEYGYGRTNCAFYGTLVQVVPIGDAEGTRIQQIALVGEDIRETEKRGTCANGAAFSDSNQNNLNTDINIIRCTGADVVHYEQSNTSGIRKLVLNDVLMDKTFLWGSALQLINTKTSNLSKNGVQYAPGSTMKAKDSGFYMILFRSPITGTINTYVRPYFAHGEGRTSNPAVTDFVAVAGKDLQNSDLATYSVNIARRLQETVNIGDTLATTGNGGLVATDVYFCVKPGNNQAYGDGKRMIGIAANAKGSSSVKLYGLDSAENKCKEINEDK